MTVRCTTGSISYHFLTFRDELRLCIVGSNEYHQEGFVEECGREVERWIEAIACQVLGTYPARRPEHISDLDFLYQKGEFLSLL